MTKIPKSKIREKLHFLHEVLPDQPTAVANLYQIPHKEREGAADTPLNELRLQAICDHMTYFLKLPLRNRVRLVTAPQLRQAGGRQSRTAGLYKTVGDRDREIVIRKLPQFRQEHYLGIMAHELTHAFLDFHNIRLGEDMENEILTDSAAVYLGFGQLLLEGYQPIVWAEAPRERSGQSVRMKSVRIGYFDRRNICFALRESARLRKIPGFAKVLPFLQRVSVLPALWRMSRQSRRQV